ncbi:DUF523 domain-containing protein [Colwellia asteriadis]|uniref:DUF523 domain-containing protein n=1 Tax=Colwellia asteriadis TaxID=517723 RepID=A0ABN1LBI9_9GAMM
MQDKILVSACFLGKKVRYNGEVKSLSNQLITQWQQEGRLMAICPEVEGGLPVPRSPAEINRNSGKVFTCDGTDVSEAFYLGAQRALALCQQFNIRFALLKESSPSCGSATIYDGSFNGSKVEGAGVTTTLLRKHGIHVFSEKNLSELANLIDSPAL